MRADHRLVLVFLRCLLVSLSVGLLALAPLLLPRSTRAELRAVLAFAPVATAQPERLAATGTGDAYSLWLRLKAVPWIPLHAPDAADAASAGEKLAVLAEKGVAIWERVRRTQERYLWLAGQIDPPGGDYQAEFLWRPDQQLALLLADGRSIPAAEIIATRGSFFIGRQLRAMPLIRIAPGGSRMRFADFRTEFPSGAKCAIYAAFPAADWRGTDVVAVEVRPPEAWATVPGDSVADTTATAQAEREVPVAALPD